MLPNQEIPDNSNNDRMLLETVYQNFQRKVKKSEHSKESCSKKERRHLISQRPQKLRLSIIHSCP